MKDINIYKKNNSIICEISNKYLNKYSLNIEDFIVGLRSCKPIISIQEAMNDIMNMLVSYTGDKPFGVNFSLEKKSDDLLVMEFFNIETFEDMEDVTEENLIEELSQKIFNEISEHLSDYECEETSFNSESFIENIEHIKANQSSELLESCDAQELDVNDVHMEVKIDSFANVCKFCNSIKINKKFIKDTKLLRYPNKDWSFIFIMQAHIGIEQCKNFDFYLANVEAKATENSLIFNKFIIYPEKEKFMNHLAENNMTILINTDAAGKVNLINGLCTD